MDPGCDPERRRRPPAALHGEGRPAPRTTRSASSRCRATRSPASTARPAPPASPTFVAYTKRDLETWSGLVARFLVAGGLRSEHLVHVAFGYGLFTGGFGLHYGIEKVGAGVVPAAGGQHPAPDHAHPRPRRRGPRLHPVLRPAHRRGRARRGVRPRRAAAPLRPLRRRALDRGDARRDRARRSASSPSTTTASPRSSARASSGECGARAGMHVQEDHFLVECVDPEDPRAGPRRRDGRARLHRRSRRRRCRCSATAPATSPRSTGALPVRPHRRPDEPRGRPHRRHAHHPRRQRVPVADRGGAAPRRGDRAALPHRGLAPRARSTRRS